MIDKLLCDYIERTVPDNNVAVLLSGGVDSLSVAFAAQRLGKKIHAYSFRLDTHTNYDYEKAKEVSELFGWEFTGVNIDTSVLDSDFYRLVAIDCVKKTHFECVYPFMYVYAEIKEEYVLSGWAADGYYGVSKKANIHYKHTKEKFDEFRDNYFLPENTAGYNWHLKVADIFNKKFITPYITDEVKEYFYAMDWHELNEPYQKHHVRDAFANEFKKAGSVKKHLNLQIESGITELFETLLDNREINFNRRSRMMDVYRDWQNPPTTDLTEFMNGEI